MNSKVALLHDACTKIYKFHDEGFDNWLFLSSQAILGRNYLSEILYLFRFRLDDSVIRKWTLADRIIELFPDVLNLWKIFLHDVVQLFLCLVNHSSTCAIELCISENLFKLSEAWDNESILLNRSARLWHHNKKQNCRLEFPCKTTWRKKWTNMNIHVDGALQKTLASPWLHCT